LPGTDSPTTTWPAVAATVQARRDLGDVALHHLDDLDPFDRHDAGDLDDGLHPNASGCARIRERIATLASSPGTRPTAGSPASPTDASGRSAAPRCGPANVVSLMNQNSEGWIWTSAAVG
jgi:hypothetical protein